MRLLMWPCALGLAVMPQLAGARTVVIMPFEPAGADQAQTDMLGGYFRDAAQKLPGVSVMTEAMTREVGSVCEVRKSARSPVMPVSITATPTPTPVALAQRPSAWIERL